MGARRAHGQRRIGITPAPCHSGGRRLHLTTATRAERTAQKIRPAEITVHKPSYGLAAIAALAVFALYVATLAPTTVMWDTSEYIAAVKVLGLPHPPGNPLFVILGHAFGLLPIPVSYAARINMFVALMDAIAAGLWFLVTERILSHWLALRWQRIAGAAVAVIAK